MFVYAYEPQHDMSDWRFSKLVGTIKGFAPASSPDAITDLKNKKMWWKMSYSEVSLVKKFTSIFFQKLR